MCPYTVGIHVLPITDVVLTKKRGALATSPKTWQF